MSLASSRLTRPSAFLSVRSNVTCSVRSEPRGVCVCVCGCVCGCVERGAGCWLGCCATAAALTPIATSVANASFFIIMTIPLLHGLQETLAVCGAGSGPQLQDTCHPLRGAPGHGSFSQVEN